MNNRASASGFLSHGMIFLVRLPLLTNKCAVMLCRKALVCCSDEICLLCYVRNLKNATKARLEFSKVLGCAKKFLLARQAKNGRFFTSQKVRDTFRKGILLAILIAPHPA